MTASETHAPLTGEWNHWSLLSTIYYTTYTAHQLIGPGVPVDLRGRGLCAYGYLKTGGS